MESLSLEQTVINKNKGPEKRRARIFKIVASVAFFLLVVVDAFAVSLLQVFYYTDKDMFTTFLLLILAFTIPLAAFIVLLFIAARRYGVEFDYRVDGKVLNIYKYLGGSTEKHIAIIEFDRILSIGKVQSPAYFKQFPPNKKRKPVICCCNNDNPNLYFIKVRFLGKNNTTYDRVIVIEPTKQLLDMLRTYAFSAEKCEGGEWTPTDEVYAI